MNDYTTVRGQLRDPEWQRGFADIDIIKSQTHHLLSDDDRRFVIRLVLQEMANSL